MIGLTPGRPATDGAKRPKSARAATLDETPTADQGPKPECYPRVGATFIASKRELDARERSGGFGLAWELRRWPRQAVRFVRGQGLVSLEDESWASADGTRLGLCRGWEARRLGSGGGSRAERAGFRRGQHRPEATGYFGP